MLLALDINAVTSTLVIGDFNTHSQTWLPRGTPCSTWANQVEQWAARNLLKLANTSGEITQKGADYERDTVIDLAWYNNTESQNAVFSGLEIDWDSCLGSDHAMLHITGSTL